MYYIILEVVPGCSQPGPPTMTYAIIGMGLYQHQIMVLAIILYDFFS